MIYTNLTKISVIVNLFKVSIVELTPFKKWSDWVVLEMKSNITKFLRPTQYGSQNELFVLSFIQFFWFQF